MEDQRKRSTGMMSHVRKLSVDIGARPPTGNAEEAAARYVEQALKRDNLSPSYERFRSRRNSAVSLAWCYVIMLGSVLFFRASPIAFTIFYLAGLLLLLLEFMGRSVIGALQWRFSSGNVVACIQPYERAERKLVLLAHLDSHREAFYYGKRLFWLYRPYIVLHVLISIGLAMWLIIMTGATILKVDDSTLVQFWRIALLAAVPLLIAFLAVLSKCLLRRHSKGADDDASGIAVLLNVAHHYSNRRPVSTEIWLVAAGCEDVGSTGLKRFIKQHRSEVKGASWIFLEGLGGEKPKCFRKEGPILPFHANRSLLRTAQDINTVYPHYGLVLGRTDSTLGSGYQLLSQGRKAITFSSRPGSEDAAARDQYEVVDPKNLQANYAFILHYIENIDKRGLSRRRRGS